MATEQKCFVKALVDSSNAGFIRAAVNVLKLTHNGNTAVFWFPRAGVGTEWGRAKRVMQQHIDIAWDFRESASAVAQKISTSDTAIGVLNFYLADFYTNIGQLDNALASITQASRHFEQCEDTERLATSYERLDEIHQALGEVDKALEFFELDNQFSKE
jgi:tetratricopeptide (TPR) repeat protein